jgi:hypothetical protein
VVDLLFKGQLGVLHRLPIDCAREIVGAVALVLLKQGIVLGDGIAARGEARSLKDILRVPCPKVTLASGKSVRLVSVMRRTVLNITGDC